MNAKLLAVLLSYPDDTLLDGLPELRAAAAELPRGERRGVEGVLDAIATTPPDDLRRAYVETFDFDRRCGLHLTYHTHGDRRQRGLELVRLKRRYAEAELPFEGSELPDYLPVVLEFASTQPPAEARAFLGELVHILSAIHAALRRLQSAYAAVIAAVVELAGERVTAVDAPAEPAIDALWEEPPAFDGCASYGRRAPPPVSVDPVRLVGEARRATLPSSRDGVMP